MDFTFTEEQLAVREAADGSSSGLVDPERVAAIEATEDRIDRELWGALAAADCWVLAYRSNSAGVSRAERTLPRARSPGRVRGPGALWATLVLGALPLAWFGSPELRARWLPPVAAGEVS